MTVKNVDTPDFVLLKAYDEGFTLYHTYGNYYVLEYRGYGMVSGTLDRMLFALEALVNLHIIKERLTVPTDEGGS